MNRDYSKLLELLNQDAEKERNKKAEKAVHDNLYNKGFRDGLAVLDKIRAQFKSHLRGVEITLEVLVENDPLRPKFEGAKETLEECLEIIDKYKAETEDT